ncbi:hypothetical protein HJC23_002027 [Cyclotella cryptica]|uniref:SET domain-containing protein n=1 Tax=Cyclotella cryptica TaxID=29204 RepID=A0ABD3NUJ2_9STRA
MVALGKASNAFLTWAASQGIETPLNLAERDDGRYVFCSEDIKAGQDLLSCPVSACIVADSLEGHTFVCWSERRLNTLLSKIELEGVAERLAYERQLGEKSKYAPYMDVLPTLDDDRLLSLPRFWDSKRLDLVTDGGQLLRRMKNDERKDIDQWALACVDSRANFLGDGTYAMTPLLDMINHDGSVQTRARIEKNKGFSGPGNVLHLSLGKDYSKGEEAFISYGNLANLDTLADYGFVTENNPCNSESIEVRMMQELEVFSTLEEGQGLGLLAKPISDRNELDVTSFIASTIAEASGEARAGANDTNDDRLIQKYLSERATLLDLALQRILAKYPGLEY